MSLPVIPSPIYFAHSLRDYRGFESKRVLQWLATWYPDAQVHNPEDFEGQFKSRARKLQSWHQAYLSILQERLGERGGVVALEHHGHIGKGVFNEISIAMDLMKRPAWVYREGGLHVVRSLQVVDTDDWAIRYGRIVT